MFYLRNDYIQLTKLAEHEAVSGGRGTTGDSALLYKYDNIKSKVKIGRDQSQII